MSTPAIVIAALLLVGVSGASTVAAEIDVNIGESIARRNCAACHTVGPTQVHELPPTFFELAQNLATTEASLEFLLTHPHDVMPNLTMGADERAEIIAYIMSLRQRAR
ncbi:MAG: c-type cytochrome [Proteobacteria bacterium]|nr:c-type cytochrome [Pseudomonadota bacterium]